MQIQTVVAHSNLRLFVSRFLDLPLLLLLITFVLVGASNAQITGTGGTVEGTISDSTGARIAGAKVTLRQTETNQSRTVTADDNGFFRATELPVGPYDVRAESQGFAPYVNTAVALDVGTTVHLDAALRAGAAGAEVTVTAQPSPIDSSQTSVTSGIDRERIEDLPVRSRNALDFVLLTPGVTSTSQQGGTGFHRVLADSGFTFGGLRPRSNNISVDGVDNNDEYSGSSRTELSPEDVREYQIVHNGLSAEYGGASGGSINVVTRTGGNVVHGDAYIYIQNAALDARDPFQTAPGKPAFQRYRFGSSIGGPIVKNRTFFHAAIEQESNRGQNGSDIAPSVATAINNFLGQGLLPPFFPRLATRQITTGFFPVVFAETEASGKVVHQLSAENSLMVRYAHTDARQAGDAFNTTDLQDASQRGSSFTADNAIVGSLTSVYGNEGIGDLRFQAATRHAVLRTNEATGPGIDIAGLIDFGRPYEGNSIRRENHYQASYTYLRNRGQHLWKVGGTINRVNSRATVPDGFGGQYLFGSLANFFTGAPDSFRQAFGNPRTDYAVISYGAFVQDHWSVLPHLAMDIGLRYDFEHLPAGLNEGTNNFSPRVGLAFSPAPRWVLRSGYGVFFDREILADLNRAIEFNGVNGFEQVANGALATNLFKGAAGGTLTSAAAGIAPSIFRADPKLATPYSQQANLGVEYLVDPDLTASVNYLFVRGVKLPRTVNGNLLPPSVLTLQNAVSLGVLNPTPQQIGNEVFGPGRSNPAFNDIYMLGNSASSTYNGFTAALTQRTSKDLEFVASYTLSKTLDDASDFDEQPQNPFNLQSERALSSQDQRQRFTFNSLWNLPIPGEIELAPIITVGTGRPVNPLVGLDSNRSDAFPLAARPIGLARNSLQTQATANVDLGIVKTVKFGDYTHVDLVTQFFNLFNHVSATAMNPFFGTGAAPLAGYDRPIQGIMTLPPENVSLSELLK